MRPPCPDMSHQNQLKSLEIPKFPYVDTVDDCHGITKLQRLPKAPISKQLPAIIVVKLVNTRLPGYSSSCKSFYRGQALHDPRIQEGRVVGTKCQVQTFSILSRVEPYGEKVLETPVPRDVDRQITHATLTNLDGGTVNCGPKELHWTRRHLSSLLLPLKTARLLLRGLFGLESKKFPRLEATVGGVPQEHMTIHSLCCV